MDGFTTEELSLILIMSSIALRSGEVKFDEKFMSVQRKVTDEICRREAAREEV